MELASLTEHAGSIEIMLFVLLKVQFIEKINFILHFLVF